MSTIADNLTRELCDSSAWGQRPLMPEEVKKIIVKHISELEKDKDRVNTIERGFLSEDDLPEVPEHLRKNVRGGLDWLKEQLDKKGANAPAGS